MTNSCEVSFCKALLLPLIVLALLCSLVVLIGVPVPSYADDYGYDEGYGESDDYDPGNLSLYVNKTSYDEYEDGLIVYGENTVKVSVYYEDGYSGYYTPVNGAAVVMTVEGKQYTGKTNSSGNVSLTMPVVKIGTKVSIKADYGTDTKSKSFTVKSVNASEKYSYYWKYADEDDDYDAYTEGRWDYREKFDDNIRISPTYKNSKKTKISLLHVTKGDKVKIKFGKKTYTKKIKKTKAKVTLKIKHKKFKAGTKIKVAYYNKFKQKMGKASSIVFEGKKIKRGLTKKQLKLTRMYGSPDRYSSGSNCWWDYTDYEDNPIRTVYFRGGRVSSWTVW